MTDPVHCTINGVARTLTADANTPLLYVLRNDLGLKGTRFGCGSGECGACFVLIDGAAVAACDTPIWSVAGKRITTIEGLADGARLHPLQQAFIDAQAAQCGYCASGMIISAAALLGRSSHPAEPDIRAALDRNLCRCGAHQRIVRAVAMAAAKGVP